MAIAVVPLNISKKRQVSQAGRHLRIPPFHVSEAW